MRVPVSCNFIVCLNSICKLYRLSLVDARTVASTPSEYITVQGVGSGLVVVKALT